MAVKNYTEPEDYTEYRMLLAIEYYLEQVGKSRLRILELGALPMGSFITPLLVDLDLPRTFRTCATDIRQPDGDKFHGINFIQGDYMKERTKEQINESLGGNPNLIIARMVFENNLDTWEKRRGNTSVLSNLPQELFQLSLNHISPNGTVMIANNRDSDFFSVPDGLKNTQKMVLETINQREQNIMFIGKNS